MSHSLTEANNLESDVWILLTVHVDSSLELSWPSTCLAFSCLCFDPDLASELFHILAKWFNFPQTLHFCPLAGHGFASECGQPPPQLRHFPLPGHALLAWGHWPPQSRHFLFPLRPVCFFPCLEFFRALVAWRPFCSMLSAYRSATSAPRAFSRILSRSRLFLRQAFRKAFDLHP